MPNSHVYFFSGTGNTLALARAYAETFIERGYQAELVDVTAYARGKPTELLSIFFPVYCFGAPRIVNNFVEQLPKGEGRRAAVFANAAGMAGPAPAMVAEALSSKGYRVVASDWILMPSNYILGREAVVPSEAESQIAEGCSRARELALAVANGTAVPRKMSKWYLLRLAYSGFQKGLLHVHKFYRATEKCTGCGVCEDLCPVKVITMQNERPRWHKGCEHCMRCVNLCPAAAIEVGRLTVGKRRYDYWRGSLVQDLPLL